MGANSLQYHKDDALLEHAQVFSYQPLTPRKAIKLLEILPMSDDTNDPIQVKGRQDRPDDTYRCLSYMWGDQAERFMILINTKTFYVGRNLYDFLHQAARRLDVSASLWMDAICINQTDIDEKSIQVQQMGDLYSKAEEAITWPGLGTESELRALRRLTSGPELIPSDTEPWEGVLGKACVP
ncbi:hypothetical protein N0V90_008554 [Kalmusia sp. IMI 367209]|nr:hypothetical protein N0V90_008554 [Kalmusia sp. IMI 367209]